MDNNLIERMQIIGGATGKFNPEHNNSKVDSIIIYKAEYIDYLVSEENKPLKVELALPTNTNNDIAITNHCIKNGGTVSASTANGFVDITAIYLPFSQWFLVYLL